MPKLTKSPEAIKAIRESAGMTQQEFASALMIDRSYLSQLENGKKNASDRLWRMIEQVEKSQQGGVNKESTEPSGEITRADVISYVNELLDVVEDRAGMISFVYWKLRREMPIDEYREDEVDHDAVMQALEDKKRAEARKRDFRSGDSESLAR